MKRPIKYKVVHKATHQVYKPNYFHFSPNGDLFGILIKEGELLSVDDFDILEYTGLKNKHGVEIYEGDIVRVEGSELRTVVYELASFHLVSDDGSRILLEDRSPEMLELVGNIYIHPGLIEKIKELESE